MPDDLQTSTLKEGKIEVASKKSFRRQTFIYSATLTLNDDVSKTSRSKKPRSSKGKNLENRLSGPIADILEQARAENQVKVIDLSIADDKAGLSKMSAKLPPGLSLYEIKCTQKHKDSYLYGLLVCTTIGTSGKND